MVNRSRTILLVVAVAAASSACSSSKPGDADVEGTWLGSLNVSATALQVVFNLTRAADGGYSGTTDSPDQAPPGPPTSPPTRAPR